MSPDLAQHIQAQLTVALAYLFEAVVPFLILQSPLYWPFLVSALVVGGLFWRFGRNSEGGRPGWREFRRRYLGRALWWHPSARVDYRYYLVNAVFFPIVVGPALVTGGAIATGLHGVAPSPHRRAARWAVRPGGG